MFLRHVSRQDALTGSFVCPAQDIPKPAPKVQKPNACMSPLACECALHSTHHAVSALDSQTPAHTGFMLASSKSLQATTQGMSPRFLHIGTCRHVPAHGEANRPWRCRTGSWRQGSRRARRAERPRCSGCGQSRASPAAGWPPAPPPSGAPPLRRAAGLRAPAATRVISITRYIGPEAYSIDSNSRRGNTGLHARYPCSESQGSCMLHACLHTELSLALLGECRA